MMDVWIHPSIHPFTFGAIFVSHQSFDGVCVGFVCWVTVGLLVTIGWMSEWTSVCMSG